MPRAAAIISHSLYKDPYPAKCRPLIADNFPPSGMWQCVLRGQWAMATMTMKSCLMAQVPRLLQTKCAQDSTPPFSDDIPNSIKNDAQKPRETETSIALQDIASLQDIHCIDTL